MTLKADDKAVYALLGIENQTEVNYAMPARVMLYDALRYTEQVAALMSYHRSKKELKTPPEILSGLKKGEKLHPVITIVVYFGAKPWDGAKNIRDLVEIPEGPLGHLVQDYEIKIIDPTALREEDFDRFQSGLGKIMKAANYASKDKTIEQLLQSDDYYHNMDMLEARILNMIMDYPLELPEQKKGKFNMCKGIEDLKQDALEEGRVAGRAEERIRMYKEEMDLSDAQIVEKLCEKLGIDKAQAEKYLASYNK